SAPNTYTTFPFGPNTALPNSVERTDNRAAVPDAPSADAIRPAATTTTATSAAPPISGLRPRLFIPSPPSHAQSAPRDRSKPRSSRPSCLGCTGSFLPPCDHSHMRGVASDQAVNLIEAQGGRLVRLAEARMLLRRCHHLVSATAPPGGQAVPGGRKRL